MQTWYYPITEVIDWAYENYGAAPTKEDSQSSILTFPSAKALACFVDDLVYKNFNDEWDVSFWLGNETKLSVTWN